MSSSSQFQAAERGIDETTSALVAWCARLSEIGCYPIIVYNN